LQMNLVSFNSIAANEDRNPLKSILEK